RGHRDRHDRRGGPVDHEHAGAHRDLIGSGRAPGRLAWLLVATTNDFKNGMTLDLDGVLWNVVEFQHVKPGKGGAFVRSKLKNVMTGQVVDRTFNAGVKVDVATVDKRDMTYLYQDGNDYVFMDSQTYDQLPVPEHAIGEAKDYLLENATA